MGHSQPTYIIEHSTGFFQSKALVLPLGIKYLELANAPPWFGLLPESHSLFGVKIILSVKRLASGVL